MSRVYIVSAYRTAIGSFLGTLSSLSPADLATQLVDKVIQKDNIPSEIIEEVIIGNVLSAGHGQNIARQVVLKSQELNNNVPAYTLNMVCGSGMKTIAEAYIKIKSGFNHAIIAGGVEVMSQSGTLLPAQVRTGVKLGNISAQDVILRDGLTDAVGNYHMGITAENLVEKYQISRQEQDEFAIESQMKARTAKANNVFNDEILPIRTMSGRNEVVFSQDEYINENTTFEKLATLRPVFKKDGSVTAGNASGINDGASVLILVSEDVVKKYQLEPLAEVIDFGVSAVEPEIMGIGPVAAIEDVLKKTNLTLDNIDNIELNEAFASQSLAVLKQLSANLETDINKILVKTNINGGAISLGHPLGASGARIVTTLIHNLKRQNQVYGLASLCIGGGMGISLVIKNLNS